MYRISVTTLEKFRRYLTDATPFDTEAALLESIKGIFRGNPKTMFGAAYHALIEGKYHHFVNDTIWAGGITFTPAQTSPAFGYRYRHPQIVSEVNVSKIYETRLMPIQVSGRVDSIEGLCIRDAKTKFRTPDFKEYMDSCQWKFYCDMLGAGTFFYDVFEVKGFKDEPDEPASGNINAQPCFFPEVKVCEVKSIACHTYPSMQDELTGLLNDFIDYVNYRELWQYIKPALPTTSIL